MVPVSLRYLRIAVRDGLVVAELDQGLASTLWLTIVSVPPPTRRLTFTRARSGSMPVVSQSIMNPIVPVGASTVTWALR